MAIAQQSTRLVLPVGNDQQHRFTYETYGHRARSTLLLDPRGAGYFHIDRRIFPLGAYVARLSLQVPSALPEKAEIAIEVVEWCADGRVPRFLLRQATAWDAALVRRANNLHFAFALFSRDTDIEFRLWASTWVGHLHLRYAKIKQVTVGGLNAPETSAVRWVGAPGDSSLNDLARRDASAWRRMPGRGQFPHADRHWAEVAAWLEKEALIEARALAPGNFQELLPRMMPSLASHVAPIDEFDLAIVHKGHVEDYPAALLEQLRRRHCYVFGNAVFVVFDLRAGAAVKRTADAHIDALVALNQERLDGDASRGPVIDNSAHFGRRNFDASAVGHRYAVVTANRMGNLGDDALTAATAAILAQADPLAQIRIIAPPSNSSVLDDVDAVVIGGGGLLYDGVLENVEYYMRYLVWAHAKGLPTACLGLGTQGIQTDSGRRIYRAVLSRCRFVSTRSQYDRDLLVNEVGVRCPVRALQDIGFLTADATAAPCLERDGRPLVLVSLADSFAMRDNERMRGYQQATESVLCELAQTHDVRGFIQSRDDLPLYLHLHKRAGIPVIDRVDQPVNGILGIYRQADLVITSRFHGTIFSALAGVPVIPVGPRGSKTYHLIESTLPSLKRAFIRTRLFTPDTFAQRLEWFSRGRLRPADRREVSHAVAGARRNVALVRRFLLSDARERHPDAAGDVEPRDYDVDSIEAERKPVEPSDLGSITTCRQC